MFFYVKNKSFLSERARSQVRCVGTPLISGPIASNICGSSAEGYRLEGLGASVHGIISLVTGNITYPIYTYIYNMYMNGIYNL
jgi:hypothetical protein